MIVNTSVVSTGCTKNHNGPKIVCLYNATKSLLTKISSKSRYRQIAPSSRENNDFLLVIVNDHEASSLQLFLGVFFKGLGIL